MGKITYLGPAPPDHPMFSSGPEMFSPLGSSQSTTSSVPSTDGVTQAKSSSAMDEETKGERLAGLQRALRYAGKNKEAAAIVQKMIDDLNAQ